MENYNNTELLNMEMLKIEQLYRDHKDHLYNYIYRLCNNHEQAEDVTQQTFIKLMADPGFEQVTNAKAYLFTVARNHLYDSWKKKRETLLDDIGIDIADSTDSSELTDELAEQQLQQAVLFCISRLSDKYRELMILRYMEDLSVNEIATITRLGESDIKVSLLRARKAFDQGLTQHMYLKVAKSRQQCDQMNAMLAPYADQDIPASELAPFEKHITACQVCNEDAEELKRTRKLLALIPLVSAPLSLDTSFNDAMAASTTNTVTKGSALIKISIGAGAVALVAGALLLLPAGKDDTTPVTNTAPAASQPSQPTHPVNSTAQGKVGETKDSVSVSGTFRLSANTPPVESHWYIYHIQENGRELNIGGVKDDKLSKQLAPGHYRIVARTGEVEVSRIVDLEAGKPLNLNLIAGAGKAKLSTPLPDNIKLYPSHVQYQVYKTRPNMEKSKTVTVKSFHTPATNITLPAGSYFVKAKYTGFGPIENIMRLDIKPGETSTLTIPLDIGMFKPVAVLSNKNLHNIRNIEWSMQKVSELKSIDPIRKRQNIKNNKETPMAPGEYMFTTQLGKITHKSRAIIRSGKVTPHKVVLQGGIFKARVWTDKTQSKSRDLIRMSIYDYEKYQQRKKNEYLPAASVINNHKNAEAILPEGKYTLVVTEYIHHKVLASKTFTINDGDTKQINLVIPK